MTKRYFSIAFTFLALSFVGCASIEPKSAEDLVGKRAEERWSLLVEGDFKKAYTYLHPSYRGLRSDSYYSQSIGKIGRWTDAKIISVKCEEKVKSCDVKVKITASLNISAKPIVTSTVVDEKWVYENGEWWKFEKI